ncbi:polyprenyl synthetase family protein [Paenibacillus hodogayensis]|uniref:Polyprenyl synthetase family protein n=1 Tax=Paenibacillus hodogayensis TaxID=279208 RepID=A0ABV5VTI5_9BACL
MRDALLQEVERTLDRLVPVPAFHALLTTFVRDKAAETSRWGEMTRHVHYMFGGRSPHIDKVAALTELIVLALDIADDLQDRDNAEKSWMQCPQELSLNAVMGLLMGAVGELGRFQAEYPDDTFPKPGEAALIVMNAVNGQYRDLTNDIVTEQDYIAVVQQKSCMLIKLAYYMGYGSLPAAAAIETEMDLLAGYVGVVSQLSNDLRDVLRYDVKNDLLHRKRTLPILFLLADEEDAFPMIRRYYEGAIDRDEFLRHKIASVDYIRESGCVEYTEVIKTLFLQKAEETFDSLSAPDPEWKERFRELVLGPKQPEETEEPADAVVPEEDAQPEKA